MWLYAIYIFYKGHLAKLFIYFTRAHYSGLYISQSVAKLFISFTRGV